MKTKKTILNLITDIVPLLIVSILGIFKLKLFVNFLGNETLGLYQLYSQIMVYVALVDGGLSSALLYALYRPNSTNDTKKFNSIIAGSFKIFSLIGIIIFTIAAVISPFVHFFIKDSVFSNGYIGLTFLLFSLSNVIEYFFVPYRCVLEVKEKKYIVNLCLQIGQIILSVFEIIMLLFNVSFIYILLMHSIIKLLSNVIISIICKKLFLFNKEKSVLDLSFTKEIKNLIFHKINGLVSYNIDILLISKFLGLSQVAIYSTYNYIVNMLRNILGKFSSSTVAIIGNFLSVNSKEKGYNLFCEIKAMMFFLAIIICVPLLFALQDFIDIWYEGKIATSFTITLSFCIYFFVYMIKMPTTIFVTSAGLFKDTKKCALVDTLVNLFLSIILLFCMGISGVIIATAIAAFIAEYCMKTDIIYNKIFDKHVGEFYKNNLKYFLILLFDLALGSLIFRNILIQNIISWFLIYLCYFLSNGILILLIFRTIKEDKFINRIKILKKREKV